MKPASGKQIKCCLRLLALLLLVDSALSKQGFILTAPNRLIPGKNETFCVAFSEDLSAVNVSYVLRRPDSEDAKDVYAEARATFSSRVGGCIALALPKGLSSYAVMLAVRGNASDGYSFREQTNLGVLSSGSEFTLIQTDKPIYKPGQTVKMRLLTLTVELIPVLDQLYQVWIEDPSGVRVEQWLNVSTGAGIAELAFKLASEPPLGAWTIICTIGQIREQVNFRVDEYVLPRFEVTIKSLPYISPDIKFVTGEICATYTYGQPVKGQIDASFQVTSSYHWSSSQENRAQPFALQLEVNGCSEYKISTAQLNVGGEGEYQYGRRLVIQATVTEHGTGVKVNASEVSVNLEYRGETIEIVGADKYKPGFKYIGKVQVTLKDGNPLPERIVEVTVRDEHIRTVFAKRIFTDAKGQAAFEIPMPGDVIHRYMVEAKLVSYKYTHDWQYPMATKQLNSWYSPSGSYLQLLEPADGSSLRCGQTAQVELEYTTNVSQTVNLRIQVVGISDIELSSTQELLLEPQQPIPWNISVETEDVVNNTDATKSDRRERRSVIDPSYGYHRAGNASKNVRQMYRGKQTLSFQVTSRMSRAAHLLVFYVRSDGEVVADAMTLAVEECVPNRVSMSFSKTTLRPGEEVSVKIDSAAGSLCAFGAVDKSIHLMDSGKRLSLSQLHSRLQDYRLSQYTGVHGDSGDYEYCKKQMEPHLSEAGVTPSGGRATQLPRWRRERFYYSMYKDASHAFQMGATAVLTDLKLNTRPCVQYNPRYMYPSSARSGMLLSMAMVDDDMRPRAYSHNVDAEQETSKSLPNVYKPNVEVRTYFPETWLWETVWINENGKAEKKQVVPHTITEWQGSAMCVNKVHGFGISETASVKVFQPFFVSVELPYSVIRDESVPVAVSIYNYLTECLAIEVTMKNSQDFVVKGSRNVTLCVCGQDSKTHQYRIIPKAIGHVNLTVTSRSIAGVKASAVCPAGAAMSEMVGVRDAVVKPLLVEPEGAAREYTLSSYVCLQPGRKNAAESFSLLLPNDTVADSARAYISVIGDVMGPSLANLDSLLKMPWGCGEQNMLGFAPNIFVMQYLEATGQANDAVRAKAVEYMKSGYQRQLTYSHPDSSYSAFGKSDANGSIWLTAFVVKCFAQARPYIYVDSKNLNQSILYFGKHQLENGCFPEVGKVLHKAMKGGLGEESDGQAPVTLTAYIAIALLEAGVSIQDPVVKRAMECLDRQTVTDSYSLALLAYAYTLHDSSSHRRAEVIEQLMLKAIAKDGTTHWERDAAATPTESPASLWSWYPKPVAADVEMTAYAMLALLGTGDAVSAVLPVVRWLTQQRNAYGGFASTQDTILAIQALAKFASVTYTGGSLMNIHVDAPAFNKTFETNNENSLILQSAQLPWLPVEKLSFTFSGQGCALVQSSVRYNIKSHGTSGPAFSTTVMAYRSAKGGQRGCKQQTLEICTRYTGRDGISNMAIVDVKMVSGWLPDKDTLQLLLSNKVVELKRYEINEKTVSLYFEQISKQKKCFRFDVVQEQLVTEAKPGSVTTYDYYDTDLRHETSYSLNSCTARKGADDGDSVALTPRLGSDPSSVRQLSKLLLQDGRPPICPICEQPVNFTSLCSSKHVYKARVVGTAAKQQLHFISDLRGKEKVPIVNVTVQYSVAPQCICTSLKSAAHGSMLIITNGVDIDAKKSGLTGTLDLGKGNAVVFALRQSVEYNLRNDLRKCNDTGVSGSG